MYMIGITQISEEAETSQMYHKMYTYQQVVVDAQSIQKKDHYTLMNKNNGVL